MVGKVLFGGGGGGVLAAAHLQRGRAQAGKGHLQVGARMRAGHQGRNDSSRQQGDLLEVKLAAMMADTFEKGYPWPAAHLPSVSIPCRYPAPPSSLPPPPHTHTHVAAHTPTCRAWTPLPHTPPAATPPAATAPAAGPLQPHPPPAPPLPAASAAARPAAQPPTPGAAAAGRRSSKQIVPGRFPCRQTRFCWRGRCHGCCGVGTVGAHCCCCCWGGWVPLALLPAPARWWGHR